MNVFLTGGTGFLGENLIAELLSRGHAVWALYRQEEKRAKVGAFLESSRAPVSSDTLHWLKGDLLEVPDLWDAWRGSPGGPSTVDTLLHGAASLRFHANDHGEPRLTNVEGSRAIRRLVDRFPMRAHILSTAYVCGFIAGQNVYEVNHPRGKFVNDYEESKWEAEQLWNGEATILRPSVIVGDSRTGRTSSYFGWYIPIKGVWMLDRFLKMSPSFDRRDLQIRIPADPTGTSNIVPVDWVAEAAVRIMERNTPKGSIFHLTHPTPPSHGFSHDVIARRFNLEGMVFAGAGSRVEEPKTEFHRMLLKQVQVMIRYFSNNPLFDRTNTDRIVPDCPAPSITEALIHRLIDYAIADNWGQKPPPSSQRSS